MHAGGTPGKGTFTISIDLELAWGDKGKERYRAQHEGEREATRAFLALADTYDVPATWATVGNLFLRERSDLERYGVPLVGRGAAAYAEWITPAHAHLWFGADIIESILCARTAHEIGGHTFFHTLTSETDEASYLTELQETRRIAHETFGLTLTSFVYPRNEGGYSDALVRAGYTAVRGQDVRVGEHRYRPLSLMHHACDELFGRSLPPVFPTRLPNGLWSLPGSYFYPKVLRGNVRAPLSMRVRKCVKSIDRAIETGGNVHLWFHPHNFGLEPAYWLRGMGEIMAYVAKEREAGRLEVCTMGTLAV